LRGALYQHANSADPIARLRARRNRQNRRRTTDKRYKISPPHDCHPRLRTGIKPSTFQSGAATPLCLSWIAIRIDPTSITRAIAVA
jgi:hypothetical protein